MKVLSIEGEHTGFIRAEKRVGKSRVWLTELGAAWWVVVMGPDDRVRKIGFVRPPQEERARQTYDDLSIPHVIGALLEGRDS